MEIYAVVDTIMDVISLINSFPFISTLYYTTFRTVSFEDHLTHDGSNISIFDHVLTVDDIIAPKMMFILHVNSAILGNNIICYFPIK